MPTRQSCDQPTRQWWHTPQRNSGGPDALADRASRSDTPGPRAATTPQGRGRNKRLGVAAQAERGLRAPGAER